MNNRGFTLIELIIVIAVLAMLSLIATPNIVGLIEKNRADNYNGTIDSIIESTKLYVSNNRYDLSFVDSEGNSAYCSPDDTNEIYAEITINDLINNGDLSSTPKNFCTDSDISVDTEIEIILNCSTRQFSYDIISNETLKRETNTGIEGLKLSKSCSELY